MSEQRARTHRWYASVRPPTESSDRAPRSEQRERESSEPAQVRGDLVVVQYWAAPLAVQHWAAP
ncbi:hypothetical protein [Streptomyces sp. NPDC058255]|uniref:hypothetical protein n=1 Tax=Streptomyces sp. NPDC058255 TaxID=3346407 RepID=UPI0036EE485B